MNFEIPYQQMLLKVLLTPQLLYCSRDKCQDPGPYSRSKSLVDFNGHGTPATTKSRYCVEPVFEIYI